MNFEYFVEELTARGFTEVIRITYDHPNTAEYPGRSDLRVTLVNANTYMVATFRSMFGSNGENRELYNGHVAGILDSRTFSPTNAFPTFQSLVKYCGTVFHDDLPNFCRFSMHMGDRRFLTRLDAIMSQTTPIEWSNVEDISSYGMEVMAWWSKEGRLIQGGGMFPPCMPFNQLIDFMKTY